jgi:two-component system phosphate regulon sensor histidine kinase PhoR
VLIAAALERETDAARASELAAELGSWLDRHAEELRAEEREALGKDLLRATALPEDTRRALTERASATGATVERDVAESVERAVTSDKVQRALGEAPVREVVTVRDGGAWVTLVPLARGGWAGFVVTTDTLARGLTGERRAAWLPSTDGTVIAATSTTPPSSDADPRAVAWVSDGLGLRAALSDPSELARRATRSRRIVAAISIGGAVVALGAAIFLVRRARAARRTSELRTTFVAAVSHELRTPLASIRMLGELLAEERVEDDERREVADALVKEAKRMGDTVERFMTFARMDRGRLVAKRELIDAAELVRERVAAFRARHPDTEVETKLDEIEARLDPRLFEIVIDNLLENAKKYAPTGAPYVVAMSRADGALRVSVEDRGPGVANGLESKIWEAFERGDDRLSKATGGTGLGLSLVRGIAVAHGGRAFVESLEKGARFVVECPLEAEAS